MDRYKFWLQTIQANMGRNITTDAELNKFKHIIPGFKGAYPFDKKPLLKNNNSMILNLDKHNQPGKHWIAIYHLNNKNYIYDSLGTYYKYPNPLPNSIYADKDREQAYKQNNCGQRSLAWILTVQSVGIKKALTI